MADGRLERGLTMALCAALLLAGCGEDPARKARRQGIQALKRGQYAQSVRLLQESLKPGDTNAPAAAVYNSLGLAYYRIGQTNNALSAFAASSRLDPEFAEPFYNTGVILAESGQDAQAVICFEKAARLDPAGARAPEYLSRILARNRQWDQERKALLEARQRAPGEPRIMTALARRELQATNVVKAISYLQEALEHDANYAPAIYNLAVVNHLWLKNDSQAEQLFKDYLRLEPTGERAPQAAAMLKDIEKMAAAGDDTNRVAAAPAGAPAAKAGTQKTAAAPEPPGRPAAPSGEELLREARTLEQQGRGEEAVNTYLRAAREAERAGKHAVRDQAARAANNLCARNAGAHYEVGLYWFERKRQDEALAHLKQAVELSNTWYEAHMALARMAMDQTEFDTAVVSLKQADQSSPERPEALWMLAHLYDHSLNLTNQAIQTYEQFNRRFRGDARAREGRDRLKTLRGGRAENAGPAVPDNAGSPKRWRWPFKSHSPANPEN